MPRYVFLNAALFCNNFDSVLAIRVAWNGKQFVTFCHSFILLNDAERYIQKPDIAFHSGFLTVGLYP